jgi:hypothetical protein
MRIPGRARRIARKVSAVWAAPPSIRSRALAVPGVRTAEVFEWLDTLGRPDGYVSLYITDAFTEALANVQPTPPTYQAQSQTFTTAVYAALDEWRAGGIYVNVQVAVVSLLSVRLSLTFAANVNYDLVALRARAAIVAAVNATPPGVLLTREMLLAPLRRINGLLVQGDEIISPAANIQAQYLMAIRTSLALVQAANLTPEQALQGSTNPDGMR